MTTPNHPTGQQPTAWHTYLTATRAARDHYLNVTHQAHLMLLTGPFPDRDGYQRVEHQAWDAYYTAARTAWQRYTNELNPGEDPPAAQHSPDLEATWAALEAEHGLNCPECGIPWRSPSPGCPHRVNNVHPQGPTFTETNGGHH